MANNGLRGKAAARRPDRMPGWAVTTGVREFRDSVASLPTACGKREAVRALASYSATWYVLQFIEAGAACWSRGTGEVAAEDFGGTGKAKLAWDLTVRRRQARPADRPAKLMTQGRQPVTVKGLQDLLPRRSLLLLRSTLRHPLALEPLQQELKHQRDRHQQQECFPRAAIFGTEDEPPADLSADSSHVRTTSVAGIWQSGRHLPNAANQGALDLPDVSTAGSTVALGKCDPLRSQRFSAAAFLAIRRLHRRFAPTENLWQHCFPERIRQLSLAGLV